MMYPSDTRQMKAALKICAQCPVKKVCGEYALDHDEEYGVWGGMSERERRRIKRSRELRRWTSMPPGS